MRDRLAALEVRLEAIARAIEDRPIEGGQKDPGGPTGTRTQPSLMELGRDNAVQITAIESVVLDIEQYLGIAGF